MARPVSSISQSYIDYNREKSRVTQSVATITAANYVAQTALYATLFTAQAALTLGNANGTRVTATFTEGAGTPPSSKDAQRERKWLVRYHDASNRKFRVEIPCADSAPLLTNSDFADPANAAVIAYKAAFEAVVVSPDDASGVTLDSLELVGREG